MKNKNELNVDHIIHEHQNALSQISAAAAYATNEIALMEIALHHIMTALCLAKGMIKLKHQIRYKGLTPDVSTKLNKDLEMDGDVFCTSIVVNHWQEYDGIFSHIAKQMEEISIRASLIFPILMEQRCVGYIWVSSPDEREWKASEVEFVKIISQVIGLAAEKLQFQQVSKLHNNMVHRLSTTSKTLNRLFAFDEALTVIGNDAVNLLEANHAAIFLRNPDGNLSCPWQYALSETHLNQIIAKEGNELTTFFLTTSSPILIPGQTSIPLPDSLQNYIYTKGIQSIVLLPLIFDANIVGSIGIFYDMHKSISLCEMDILEIFASQAAATLQNAWIYDQLEKGYRNMALALADSMDQRSKMISKHSRLVAKRTMELASALGCTSDEQQDIYWASLLHDIGKISIPDNVLQKPGPLSQEEWGLLQQYPAKGEELVQALSQFENVGNIIRSFREHFDGEGYPDHLKGRKIPLGARVLAVVDAYETIISERPYQKSRTSIEAIEEIKRCSGNQFDPMVVEAFLRVVNKSLDLLVS